MILRQFRGQWYEVPHGRSREEQMEFERKRRGVRVSMKEVRSRGVREAVMRVKRAWESNETTD